MVDLNMRADNSAEASSLAKPSRGRNFAPLISVLLLAAVYWRVDFGHLGRTLAQIHADTALLLLLLYAASQALSSFKWNIFLNEAGIDRPLLLCLRAYFLGMFVNTFGLGTVGGDVARSLLVRPGEGRKAAALGTVVADRVHGVLVLLVIGCAGAAVSARLPFGQLAAAIGLAGLILLLLLFRTADRLLESPSLGSGRLLRTLRSASAAVPRRPAVLLPCSLIAASAHSLQIFMHVIIAQQLGLHIEPAYYLAMVPAVSIASCLPISINGLGVREGMFLLWLAPFGGSLETAAAFGAVWLVCIGTVAALSAVAAGVLPLQIVQNPAGERS